MPKQNNNMLKDGVSSVSSVDGAGGRVISKRTTQLSLMGNDRSVSRGGNLQVSKINALKVSINEHNDAIVKILLTSKETAEKRTQIESAVRYCKEAFFEVAGMLTHLLEEGERPRELRQSRMLLEMFWEILR